MPKRLDIRVASPCSESWAGMELRGAGRHCERCDKTVVDLSRVTRSQAEAIVRAHGGSLCGRLAEDERGVTVFRAERKRLPVFAPMALAGLLAACAPEPGDSPAEGETGEVFEPEDEYESPGLGLSSSSFGGSLATGVTMPVAPESAPQVAVVQISPGASGPGSDGTPTAEQVALTRRKHRRQSQVPIIHHTAGVIACPID